jgi:N-acetylglucosaminyldiphosphoundecaprenol N-acetyl-beta-D-mannosaminyltransferase
MTRSGQPYLRHAGRAGWDAPAAGRRRSPAEISCADVVGVPLAITTYDAVTDWMRAVIAARERATVSAAAVNLVMCAHEDPSVARALRSTTLLVPDGQPLVWALRLLGHRSATRVYGPELMARLCALAAREEIPVYLYGGRDARALQQLQARLRERFPGLRIAGGFSPPFRALTPAEEDRVAAEIDACGARVVFAGIGQPKQEEWMARMRPRLAAPLLVGVGAAFDFHAGLVRQAPPWLGGAGLEWAWRLAHEPRRLWRRYARYNPRFIAAFAHQYLSAGN